MRIRPAGGTLVLLASFAFAAAAQAEALSITASVNKASVALNEQLVLTVTVSGDRTSLPEPRMPSMPRFNVHSAGRSQNFSFVNGRVSSSVQYNYVLVPRLIGNASIPPITVSEGSQKSSTEPIEVTITRYAGAQAPGPSPQAQRTPSGGASPRGGTRRRPAPAGRQNGKEAPPDVFVTAEADKHAPYVGEQVLLTVRFHTAVPLLGNAEWSPPETKGFFSEDLPPKQPQQTVYEGRRYMFSEIQIALFPIEPGRLTIGPGTVRCQVRRDVSVDPYAGDFFRQFFSQGVRSSEPRTLNTRPITVTTRALPESGKPAGFTGAVGSYSIRAEVDTTETTVGEAVNLTVTVKGRGNLKTLGDLDLPELQEFRVYETASSLNQAKGAGGVSGSKVYKTILVPKVSGRLVIPSIPFHYFDPAGKRYVSLRTRPVKLRVEAGETSPAPVGFLATGEGAAITTVAENIRHIHRVLREPRLDRAAASVARAGWFHLLPLALLLASLAVYFYREWLLHDPVGARSRRALSSARQRVRKSRAAGEPQRAAAMLADALSSYLADKLNRPAFGLTLRETQQLLRTRYPKLPDGHIEQVRRLWGELEVFRFAPSAGRETAYLADGVSELVAALEEEMRK
ncbi:MAG: BatD family protein [Elusimicrobiota bacterium]